MPINQLRYNVNLLLGRDGIKDSTNNQQTLEKLYDLKISSIVVEGGTKIINKFIESNLWDEANVVIGQNTFEKGIKAPEIPHGLYEIENIGGDTLKIYYNQKYF
jgi:diaminohydroxyphosphoribosylaminopyrimidine deaminase/5-amino-6-(5-phosphoribosylamino)uracil reductase